MSGEIQKRIKQIIASSDPAELAKVGYREWVAKTPIGKPGTWKSGKAPAGYTPGNARRSTKLDQDTIHANYAYATRLDRGWSKQFGGQGMSRPALAAIQAYVKNKLKKRGV